MKVDAKRLLAWMRNEKLLPEEADLDALVARFQFAMETEPNDRGEYTVDGYGGYHLIWQRTYKKRTFKVFVSYSDYAVTVTGHSEVTWGWNLDDCQRQIDAAFGEDQAPELLG